MSEEKRRRKRGEYPYKRDTGIARLPSGHPIREETRDLLNKKMSGGTLPTRKATVGTEGFKPDERTTRELQEARWSGLRQNVISRQLEIWMNGQILKRLPLDEVGRNPGKLASAMEELFGTTQLIEMDRDHGALQIPHIFKNPHGE